MRLRYKILIVTVTVATAFAAGRYTLPEKVRIETKIVEVEKKTKDTTTDVEKKRRKKTIVTIITKPDGSKTEEKVITDDTDTERTKREREESQRKSASDRVETITNSNRLTVLGLGGFDFTNRRPAFGVSIARPLIGPVVVGAWALTPGVVGLSVGLNF